MVTWEQLYDLLGIKDFIYFISSPAIQDALFPVKIIFIFFAVFFLCAVIYFYLNSSYIKYQFLQDTAEFFSWQPYGLIEVNRRWNKIAKRAESGLEHEYKLAIIDADDFLYQTLEERGFKGETFEELVDSAGRRMLPNLDEVLLAHSARNSIVYNPDYTLDFETALKFLGVYEGAIKNTALG